MAARLIRGLLAPGVALACAAFMGTALAGDAPELSAAELANALGVHWWSVQLPADMNGTASIGVQWISGDGAGLTGASCTMTNTSLTAGALIRIYCRDEPGGPTVMIDTPKGEITTPFPSISMTAAATGGLINGAEAKNGDLLLKLIKRAPDGSLTVPDGNTLNPGDIGLRLVIRAGQRN